MCLGMKPSRPCGRQSNRPQNTYEHTTRMSNKQQHKQKQKSKAYVEVLEAARLDGVGAVDGLVLVLVEVEEADGGVLRQNEGRAGAEVVGGKRLGGLVLQP